MGVKWIFPLLWVLLITQVVSCSSVGRKQTAKFRQLVKTGQYKAASKMAHGEKFHSSKKSALLRLIETGLVDHFAGYHHLSAQTFEKARELGNKLFTVSISKKIKTVIVDDTSDNYYPSMMVQSQIRFYLALNYYLVSTQKNYLAQAVNDKKDESEQDWQDKLVATELSDVDRKNYLMKSRAILLEWDSLIKNFLSQFKGDPVFKNDMSHKLLGAIIHESVGTNIDRTIAKNLLLDAKKLLNRNYAMYDYFNLNNKKYISDFDTLHNLKESEFKKNYIAPTSRYHQLISYVDQQVKRLKSKKNRSNFSLILQYGMVPAKVQNVTYVPLPVTTGLSMSYTNIKLPKITRKNHLYDFSLEIQKKGSEKKELIPLVTMNPISSIVYREFTEELPGIQAKTIARFVTKQVAAAASGVAATNTKGGVAAGFAVLSLASTISQAVEQADTRQWSILPHEALLGRTYLDSGEYLVHLISMKNGKELHRKLIKVATINSETSNVLNIKIGD
ncbi:MAG: hypothetical protein HOE90_13370 [Bacteriovoracaceae bacterium]|jgi:hypothetical protein|nr:hypothetical protein [Bacteriovoracaceae bacterium]